MIFNFYFRPPENSRPLKSGWVLEYNSIKKNINTLPYYTAGDKDDNFSTGLYTFTCNFTLDNNISFPLIFLPYIAGNGIKVYLDEIFIEQAGDLKKGNASIWNKAHIFSFPENLTKGNHSLKIDIFGLYEAGILTIPFIQSRKNGLVRKQFLYFYSQYLVEIISGILIILSTIFIITGYKIHENSRLNIYMGLFFISINLFFLDYSFIDYFYIDYLIFKKISFSGISLSIIFLILLVNRLFSLQNNRIDKGIIVFYSAVLVLGIFFTNNVIELRNIYSKTYPSVIIGFIYIAVKIILTKQRNIQTKLFLAGITSVIVLSAYDTVHLFFHSGTVFYTHIGLTIFVIFISAIAIYNILEIHTLVAVEKTRADVFHKESLTDSLTGIYNRRMFAVLDEILQSIYSIIIFDMNKFKQINDTYGHSAGDDVLKKIPEIIHVATRETDYLIRYGGDEFILVLPGCRKKKASELEKRILGETGIFKIYSDEKEIPFSFSTGVYTAENGENLETAIKKADKTLYKNKSNQVL